GRRRRGRDPHGGGGGRGGVLPLDTLERPSPGGGGDGRSAGACERGVPRRAVRRRTRGRQVRPPPGLPRRVGGARRVGVAALRPGRGGQAAVRCAIFVTSGSMSRAASGPNAARIST